MDGNGRWAQQRHRPRIIGHRAGARAVNRCVEFCLERGVGALTLFAFSSENWNRPTEEVGGLMKLFLGALEREVDELHRLGARLRFIGERGRFDGAILARMQAAEAMTAGNTRLQLSIAASYGGRQDIAQAARALADLPAPDLLIRTGGEQRISNFLLWQAAYAELWFTDTLWPDVDAAVLDAAFEEFARRQRRFGLTGAQASSHGASA